MADSNSDVKLLNNQVKVEAWDLCLDSPDPARRHNDTAYRRALVHDHNDGLTINWGYDYPGGVTINDLKVKGGAKIEGRAEIEGDVAFKAEDPRDGSIDIIRATLHVSGDCPEMGEPGLGGGPDLITVTTSYGQSWIRSDQHLDISATKILNFESEEIHLKTTRGMKIEGSLTVNNVRVKVEVPGSSPLRREAKYKYIDINLVHEILELQKEVMLLKNRINALES
ncbi:MAG: hypothetical protein WBM99_06235 [Psychromonas sp.]